MKSKYDVASTVANVHRLSCELSRTDSVKTLISGPILVPCSSLEVYQAGS